MNPEVNFRAAKHAKTHELLSMNSQLVKEDHFLSHLVKDDRQTLHPQMGHPISKLGQTFRSLWYTPLL